MNLTASQQYIRSLQSKSGRQSMQSTLDNIVRLLGGSQHQNYDWSLLDNETVEFVKNELIEKDYAPATIRKYLAALRGVARYAWRSGAITHEAYLHITQVKVPRGSRVRAGRALELSEINHFYDFIKTTTLSGKRNLSMFVLLVECGMRRGDLNILNCSSINWDDFSLRYIAKGNKERITFLSKKAAEALMDYLNYHPYCQEPDSPLFIPIRRNDNPVNKRLNVRSINKILDKCRKELGIHSFSPHDLRRTFATHLFDKGVDVKLVQDAMGHSQIATTVQYDRRQEKRTKELMNEFSYGEDKYSK